jgi:putative addiction module killer protein
VFEIQKTDEFDNWLSGISGPKIVSRIERLGLGNAGDVKPVGEGISEMRLSFGPVIEFITNRQARRLF